MHVELLVSTTAVESVVLTMGGGSSGAVNVLGDAFPLWLKYHSIF